MKITRLTYGRSTSPGSAVLDVNRAWLPGEAIAALNATRELNRVVEQPARPWSSTCTCVVMSANRYDHLTVDPVPEGVDNAANVAVAPDRPGIGATVDTDALGDPVAAHEEQT